jgi:ribose 1,5-bisphosphokinase PhnN
VVLDLTVCGKFAQSDGDPEHYIGADMGGSMVRSMNGCVQREWHLMASLVYVTGVPGAGKSSVRRELIRRGRAALGTDEDGLAAFYRADGSEVPSHEVIDSAEWRLDHIWRLMVARLDELVERQDVDPIYVCGSVANEGEVWDRFAVVIGLVVDDATLRDRLANRSGNSFGKSGDELALALGWNRTYAMDAASWGVVTVDATGPLEAVVDEVLDIAELG